MKSTQHYQSCSGKLWRVRKTPNRQAGHASVSMPHQSTLEGQTAARQAHMHV